MAIHFRDASLAPLQQVTVSAPDGALIGVIGEDGSGVRQLLQVAAHQGSARYLGPLDPLNLQPAPAIALDQTLANLDALTRGQALIAFDWLRRQGTVILLASHDLDLLQQIADEIWWLDGGKLRAKGDPGEVTGQYRQHIAQRLRAWGETMGAPMSPSLRRGDGRAEILAIETLGPDGRPTIVVQSGEAMTVRVTVHFRHAVDNPVVGIMIRTRIGSEVYGTNTELERYPLGSFAAGDQVQVMFRFPCQLCPQEYTVTAASHDANGVWHDWVEDAVAFSVADNRYTAGVANLRAEVAAVRAVGQA